MSTVRQPVNEYPELFAYPSEGKPPAVPNMMVISGVDLTTNKKGKKGDRSRVDPPRTDPSVITLYAPSFRITLLCLRQMGAGGIPTRPKVSLVVGIVSEC